MTKAQIACALIALPAALSAQQFSRAVTTPDEAREAAGQAVKTLLTGLPIADSTRAVILQVYTTASLRLLEIRFAKDGGTCERVTESYKLQLNRNATMIGLMPDSTSRQTLRDRLELRKPFPPSKINPECADTLSSRVGTDHTRLE